MHPADPETIIVSDSSDDDETLAKARVKKKKLVNYRAGSFLCDDLDVERIARRTGWLSGEGLAVFVQGQLDVRGHRDISVVHPRTLLDVELYHEALLEGEGGGSAERATIDRALSQVRDVYRDLHSAHCVQLVHPAEARKWLVLGHVASPPHWTLLEIRWQERKIFFYDSFARVGGYAAKLDASVRQFLQMCEVYFNAQLDVERLVWVGEQVRNSGRYISLRMRTDNMPAACATNEQLGLRSVCCSGRM